jgi:hypothetical protein
VVPDWNSLQRFRTRHLHEQVSKIIRYNAQASGLHEGEGRQRQSENAHCDNSADFPRDTRGFQLGKYSLEPKEPASPEVMKSKTIQDYFLHSS